MDRAEQRALRADRRARLVPLLLGTLAIAGLLPRSASGCPENQVRFGALLATNSSAVHSATFGPSDSCDFGAVSWDLVQGTLALDQRPCTASSSKCQVADSYTVVGLPAGTPVLVLAYLDVHGETPLLCGGAGCGVTRRAELAGTFATSAFWPDPGTIDGQLATLVQAVAGTPFSIQATLEIPTCGGGSEGRLEGSLSFQLLSKGGIVSCQGFAGTVTPARMTSWGQVKANYR